MLRHYVYNHHEAWVSRLPYAEFAINNSVSTSTGHTPFYLNYGEHPTTPIAQSIPELEDAPQAADTIQKIQAALDDAREKMLQAQKRQAYYANSSRKEKTFNVGDKVMIRTANYLDRMRKKTDIRVATRLLPRFIGPYPITHKYSDVVYKVQLPARWSNVHPVFHVSQLSPYRTSDVFDTRQHPPKEGPPILRQAMTGDMVEAIIGRKYYGYSSIDGHEYKYLVIWKGQNKASAQWVHPNAIKKNGRQHPLVTKINNEVAFQKDEPLPGSHEHVPLTSSSRLQERGNVSTGMTADTNVTSSTRRLRTIPKKK
jgi:hypothetical protein